MTTPTPRFENDDQAAEHWLRLLRDGTPDQQIEARERLSWIFERRGMLEEATDLLEGNGRAGVRTRALFTRLARLYRELGRDDDAIAASTEAALLAPPPEPAAERPSAPPAIHPQRPPAPRKRKLRPVQLVAIGIGAVLLSLCACGTIVAVIGSQLPKPSATPTAIAAKPTVGPAAPATARPTLVPTAAPTPPPTPAPAQARPAEPTPVPVAKPKPTGISPEARAYLDWAIPEINVATQAMRGLATQSEQASQNPRVIATNDWRIKTGVALGFMKNSGENLQKYPGTVTPELRRLDGLMKGLGSDLVAVADEFAAGLDQGSVARINTATARMNAATQKMQEATAEVQQLNRGG